MKTNHRRKYKDRRGPRTVFSRYIAKEVQAIALDGVLVAAMATNGDHCCGKRGIRRDVAGAKKFVRSRIRRRDRDALKKMLLED